MSLKVDHRAGEVARRRQRLREIGRLADDQLPGQNDPKEIWKAIRDLAAQLEQLR